MNGILSITVSVIGIFLITGAILVILNDNQDSGRKVAWILTIGILPVIGLLLYIIFGMNFRKHRTAAVHHFRNEFPQTRLLPVPEPEIP